MQLENCVKVHNCGFNTEKQTDVGGQPRRRRISVAEWSSKEQHWESSEHRGGEENACSALHIGGLINEAQ